MSEPQRKATDPETHMGVFKTHAEVPERYRLAHHAAAYAGRDVWAEWLDADLFERVHAERSRRHARSVGDAWATHCQSRGHHHALATPDDVETWFAGLLDQLAIETVFSRRYTWLERFSCGSRPNTDHPHVYHPVWMAAAANPDGATGQLWAHKMTQTRP